MPILALKLLLTPLLVGGASIAARRWGPAIGGWFVSLPLTSGPVLLFLAIEQGAGFAVATTAGTIVGMAAMAAMAAFCLGYLAASRAGAVAAIAGAGAAWVAAALLAQALVGLPFGILAIGAAGVVAVARLGFGTPAGTAAARVHPRWDLPARVLVGTTLVVGLTTFAPVLGPTWSGLTATFPAYVSVLAAFEHATIGRPAALDVLRGLLTGLFGTIAFFAVLRVLLEPAGPVVAFPAAVAVTGLVGAASLRVIRQPGAAVEPDVA